MSAENDDFVVPTVIIERYNSYSGPGWATELVTISTNARQCSMPPLKCKSQAYCPHTGTITI